MPASAVAVTPEVLHARFATKISRHIVAMLGRDNERDDLVQDVLLAVLRRIGTLRNPDSLDAWVAQVTTNTLKYQLRRRRFRRHISWEGLPDRQLPTFQPNLHARELASRALRIMARLPESDQTLLESYWFGPATAESLAADAGCSIITVRRRLSKAKNRFAKLARCDDELALCIDDARAWSRRWKAAPSTLRPEPVV
ncbi:MAG TPA: RNA polymerase sigma factor [Polyangiaceae bacterium]